MAVSKTLKFKENFYAAFLFDMDGTLLDSSGVVERTWREWANRHELDPDDLLAAVHGVRAEDTVRRFAPSGVDIAAEVARLSEAEVSDVEGIVPILGAKAFLDTLDHASWAVVTSAPRVLAQTRLRAASIRVPRVLIGAEDVTHGKPDPEGYLKAAQALGVSIGDCLVFEDSVAGVQAGKAAGAHVAIVGGLVSADQGRFSISNYL
jgi:mannitol-1-/sugar-/sorbitol-6-phosphatase